MSDDECESVGVNVQERKEGSAIAPDRDRRRVRNVSNGQSQRDGRKENNDERERRESKVREEGRQGDKREGHKGSVIKRCREGFEPQVKQRDWSWSTSSFTRTCVLCTLFVFLYSSSTPLRPPVVRHEFFLFSQECGPVRPFVIVDRTPFTPL